MSQTPGPGDNRTGITAAGSLGEQMVEATREFPPSSPGNAEAIADVRVAYAEAGESLGEVAPPPLFMDKLGERLAFERAGARLYEALLSKHRAYGAFTGGPSADDILDILQDEYRHADILQRAITGLGGDATAPTPSANLAANISAGLPQVLSDPRTNLRQSLEAILVAELADNECWTALAMLARQGGHDDLARAFQEATANEREHLMRVRQWLAAGQGREAGEGVAFQVTSEEEFTFAADSAVDREGYVVSEEEAREGTTEAPKTRKTRKRRSRDTR
jgi:rubrerythrin